MRDISAPFQPSPRATPRFSPMTERNRPPNRIDYLSTSFQPIDLSEELSYDKYVGPTPESNWVIPGVLLVGAYPASQDDTETFELLTSILKLGITKFVCLQLEYKAGVTESQWRSGQALRPYFEDVSLLVKNKQMFKVLANDGNVCSSEELSFVHFPIKDCSVTDDGGVFTLAVELVEALAAGEVMYLHCWGGHGRTGTLVCIMLHLMYNLNATDAMAYCQRTHDLRQCPVVVGSPQTQSQCDQVSRIVAIMEKQEKRHLEEVERSRLEAVPESSSGITNGSGDEKRVASHFTFEEHQHQPQQQQQQQHLQQGHQVQGGGGCEEEEELLCKRMAGKSFDSVEQDGVYHVTPPESSGDSSDSCMNGGDHNSGENGSNSSRQDQQNATSSDVTTTLPPSPTITTSTATNSHGQDSSSIISSESEPSPVPSTQPPLKFRLVEKDVNRTRNAYTQRVLGQVPMSSLPPSTNNHSRTPPNGKSKNTIKSTTDDSAAKGNGSIASITAGSGSDNESQSCTKMDVPSGGMDSLPAVQTFNTSNSTSSNTHHPPPPTTSPNIQVPEKILVQAQPPKHSHRSSSGNRGGLGGLRGLRTQSSSESGGSDNNGDGRMTNEGVSSTKSESQGSELDKNDEISGATHTENDSTVTSEHDNKKTKWSIGNPFSSSNTQTQTPPETSSDITSAGASSTTLSTLNNAPH